MRSSDGKILAIGYDASHNDLSLQQQRLSRQRHGRHRLRHERRHSNRFCLRHCPAIRSIIARGIDPSRHFKMAHYTTIDSPDASFGINAAPHSDLAGLIAKAFGTPEAMP
jgi:hypothetical protein